MFLIGIYYLPAVIAAGQSLSAATPLGAYTMVGISMPAVWTAASLSFQVSSDGGATWQELFNDNGTAVSIPAASAAAGQFIALTTNSNYTWRGINMMKVRSGTVGVPVVQTIGATVTLVARNELT